MRALASNLAVGSALAVALALPMAAHATEPPGVGHLVAAHDDVFLHRLGKKEPAPAGQALQAGDALETGKTGRAKILLDDGGVLNLGGGSRLELGKASTPASLEVRLVRGVLRAWSQAGDRARHRVRSARAVVEGRGASFVLREAEGSAVVVVLAGEATVRAPGSSAPSVRVAAGSALTCAGTDAGRCTEAPAQSPPALVRVTVADTRVAARLVPEATVRARADAVMMRAEAKAGEDGDDDSPVASVSEDSDQAEGPEKKRKSGSGAGGDLSSIVSGAANNGANLNPPQSAGDKLSITGRTGRRY